MSLFRINLEVTFTIFCVNDKKSLHDFPTYIELKHLFIIHGAVCWRHSSTSHWVEANDRVFRKSAIVDLALINYIPKEVGSRLARLYRRDTELIFI